MLNDNIEFSIYYLCDNKIELEKVKEYIDSIKAEKENSIEKNRKILFNKL